MGLFQWLFRPPDIETLNVPRLIEALISGHPEAYRRSAARALGERRDPRAIEPLIAALEGSGVGDDAAAALAAFGDQRAIDALIGWHLRGNNWREEEVARALDELDPNWHQRDAAIDAVPYLIQRLHSGLQGGFSSLLASSASLRLVRIGRPAVDALLSVLAGEAPEAWGMALAALGEIGDARAVEPIIAALTRPSLTRSAASALGNFRDLRAVGPLLSALPGALSTDAGSIMNALDAIDPEWANSEIAASLVPKLAEQLQIPDIVTEYRSENGEPMEVFGLRASSVVVGVGNMADKRGTAAQILGRLGDLRAVPPLIVALDDPVASVFFDAREALTRIAGQDYPNSELARLVEEARQRRY